MRGRAISEDGFVVGERIGPVKLPADGEVGQHGLAARVKYRSIVEWSMFGPNRCRNAFLIVDLGTRRRSMDRQSSIRSATSSVLGLRPCIVLFYDVSFKERKACRCLFGGI